MVKNICLLLLFLFLFQDTVFSQKVLMEENVKANYQTLLKGPNRRHYYHIYLDYGFILGGTKGYGAEVLYGKSSTFTSGLRYKLKVLRFYAVGFDVNYHFQAFHLKQDSTTKIVPNAEVHFQEKLKFHNAGTEIYNRINIGRRGDRIGNFVDFALYFNWSFLIKHYTEDKLDQRNEYRAKFVETVNKQLDYTNNFHYGLRVRLGFNRYVISASYRLSNILNDTFDVCLPRYTLGLQIGLHE